MNAALIPKETHKIVVFCLRVTDGQWGIGSKFPLSTVILGHGLFHGENIIISDRMAPNLSGMKSEQL